VEITGKVVQEIVGGTGDGEADAVKAELHDILHRYANRSTLHVNLHLEAK
jgi:protein subunit release factor A